VSGIILCVSGALTSTAQQRTLTAADLPKTIPQFDKSLQGVKGKALTEMIWFQPYDWSNLLLALNSTHPDFLKGVTAKELIWELSNIRAASFEELLPVILPALIERTVEPRRHISEDLGSYKLQFGQGRGMTALVFSGIFQAHVPLLFYQIASTEDKTGSENIISGGFNEYEYVFNGLTANVREEIKFSVDKKYVTIHHLKREIVEQNGDPTALGRHVVERGFYGSASEKNSLQPRHPRKLKVVSTHRATTETIRQVTVERCPDGNGLSHGETLASSTIRITAAASISGSPVFMEVVSRGNLKGQVSDAAELMSFDWEVKSNARKESLNDGQNFGITGSMTLNSWDFKGAGTPSFNFGETNVTGVGTTEEAKKMLSIMNASRTDALALILLAYSFAETEWRNGGCIELVVASGSEPKKLTSGEARRVVVEARHSNDPSPTSVPVLGNPWGGTITPDKQVKTPSAGFTFKLGANGESSGGVRFSSVSRRGIAKDAYVDFNLGKVPVKIELSYFENTSKTLKRPTLPGVDIKGGDEKETTTSAHSLVIYHHPSAAALNRGFLIAVDGEKAEPGSKTQYIIDEGYVGYEKKTELAEISAKAGNVDIVTSREEGENSSFDAFSNPRYKSTVMLTKGNKSEPAMFMWQVSYLAKKDGEEFVAGNSFYISKGDEGVRWIEKKITDPQSPYKTEYLISLTLDAAEELKQANKAMKDWLGMDVDDMTNTIDPTKKKTNMETATGSKKLTIKILSPFP